MLNHEAQLCAIWAENNRDVTRVYFFGSRVWGNPRPDSDLDVLVVAHPGAVMLNDNAWTDELSARLGLKVHLNDYCTADDELICAIKAKGLLVFSRHGDDRDLQFEDEIIEIDVGAA